MDDMLQEQNVGSGEGKNPVQQSSMAYGVLNADVFIQEITSTIEAKLHNEIQSLINEHRSTSEVSNAKIDGLTRQNEESLKRVDELTRKNEELHAKIDELTRKNEESLKRVDELTRKNEELDAKIDELTRKNEESDAKIDELTRKNEESLKRVDSLIKQNENLCADYRKIMAQFNSAQCRNHGQNRLLIRSVTGKMKLHHCCLTC